MVQLHSSVLRKRPLESSTVAVDPELAIRIRSSDYTTPIGLETPWLLSASGLRIAPPAASQIANTSLASRSVTIASPVLVIAMPETELADATKRALPVNAVHA